MGHKAATFLVLLVLFVVCSSVFSSAAASRNLKLLGDELAAQDLLHQGTETDISVGNGEQSNAEESMKEGRMDFETTDYTGTGANNHHDPKAPGSILN